jgi:hypothetical protein
MILLLTLISFPLTSFAQNSASSEAPKKTKKADDDKAEETAEAAPNAATAEATDRDGDGKPDEPSKDRKKRKRGAKPTGKPSTKTVSASEDKAAATGAGNVAEASSIKEARDLIDAGIMKLPSNNPAFPYLVQAPSTPEGQLPPPPIGIFEPDSPNTGEARPGSGSSTNQAVSPLAQGVAEPPDPVVPTAEPGDVAGPAQGYTPPQIELEVPDLEMLPPPLPEGEYITPDREYLENRPLPPIDQTETDEERIASNIEESLKLIDLGKETREGPVQMPLAPGVLAYSADQQIQLDRRNRKYILVGNASVYYGDIAIWADRIEVNDSAASAYAKGYVAVQRQDDILYADELYINYDTQVLELFNVEGNTGGPRIEGTVYFFAHRAYGTFDRMLLDAVEITTCDPACGDPKEVHLSAHSAVYKAGRSIVVSDIYVYVREHKVAYIPAIGIPIPKEQRLPENENSDLQQTYGYSNEDGVFAKFAYTYWQRYAGNDPVTGQPKLSGPLLGVAVLNLSQKKGPGIGIRQDLYNPSLGVTLLRGYYQEEWDWRRETLADGTKAEPERNLVLDFSQELNLSKALKGGIEVRRNDTIRPSFTTIQGGRRSIRTNNWNSSFDLAYAKGDTRVALTGTQTIDISGGQPNQAGDQLRRVNTNTNLTLQAEQQITDEIRFNAAETYTSVKGAQSGTPADQEGNFTSSLVFTPAQDSALRGYSARVNVQQQTDLDGEKNRTATDQNKAIREELPAIDISLPPDLLGDGNFFNSFQINLDNLVTGTRRRPETAFRAKFQVGGADQWQINSSARLDSRLNMRQYFYDDGNAQYVIEPNLNYRYDSFNGWAFNSSYRLKFQQGVRNPPVQGDAERYAHDLTYDFTFTNYRSWRWRLGSGFDLTHTPYTPTTDILDDKRWYTPRALSSTFTWDPNDVTSFAHTTSYNPLTDNWGSTVIGASFRSPYVRPNGVYNWYLGVGLNADTNYWNRWQTTSLDLDWMKQYDRGWSTQVTGSFRPEGTQILPENYVPGTLPLPDKFQNNSSDILETVNWDDVIRRIVVRKQNCCTTLELGWRVGINEVYVNAYLNALPQYPVTVTSVQPFQGPMDDDFFFDVGFPSDRVFNDVQQELFPGSTIPGLGVGGLL